MTAELCLLCPGLSVILSAKEIVQEVENSAAIHLDVWNLLEQP